MTAFTTTINAMYTLQQPDPDYVVNVLWQVTGVDGQYTAEIGGNTQFDSSQAPENFVLPSMEAVLLPSTPVTVHSTLQT